MNFFQSEKTSVQVSMVPKLSMSLKCYLKSVHLIQIVVGVNGQFECCQSSIMYIV